MSKAYTYKAFGLIFSSEFEIPEFIKSNEEPEIKIKLGIVPKQLKSISEKGIKYQVAKNEFLLEVDEIAKYYVKNGNEIIVESKRKNVDKEIRLFLLGSVLGALFLQRGLLPIHGSSVKINNQAFIFTGLSGVGKSSLAAFFAKKGYQILADDICVINKNHDVEPGFPKMKIWKDIMDKLGIKDNSLNKIRPEIMKFHVSVQNNFYSKPVKLDKILILNTRNDAGFKCEEITGLQKFNIIKANTFRYKFIDGLGLQLKHFQLLNKLLPEIKVYRITRPQSPIMLEELTKFILETFNLDE